MSDVDAAADSFGVSELLRHLDEPAAIQAGGILEKYQGTVRPLAEAGIHPDASTPRAVFATRSGIDRILGTRWNSTGRYANSTKSQPQHGT